MRKHLIEQESGKHRPVRISHEHKAPVTWRENYFERTIAFLFGIINDRFSDGDERSAYFVRLVFFNGGHDDSYERLGG